MSVIVRGSNKLVLEEAARSLHDALCVIRCLVKKRSVILFEMSTYIFGLKLIFKFNAPFYLRYIIAGGGAPETELAYQLTQYAQGLPGVEAYCLR